MPEYATIKAELDCWNCGTRIDSIVNIQWGKLPAGYKVGDQIDWFSIEGVTTPPFVLVEGQNNWNCGDPQITSLLALDCVVYANDADVTPTCSSCDEKIEVVAVKIEENKIISADSFSRMTFDDLVGSSESGSVDIFVVIDGKYEAKGEWYDHPLKYVEQFP